MSYTEERQNGGNRRGRKNVEKLREQRGQAQRDAAVGRATTTPNSGDTKNSAPKKGSAKKTTHKKHAQKKRGRGGGRRRNNLQTNAERVVSATRQQGADANKKIPPIAEDTLRVIPVGGNEEVGRNMNALEYGNDIVIIDIGMQFAEEDMPGIDYIVPNTSYFKGKEQNIRAVIFTHGHLDHIGAAPVVLKELGYPTIIARDLTLALIKKKMEDYDPGSAEKLKTVSIKDIDKKVRLGAFTANFFEVDHSIMDCMGIALETPVGTPIHLGDWTINHDPADGGAISYEQLSKFPEPRILMLESLSAINTKPPKSEKVMQGNLQTLVENAPGRVIIGTFASQVRRIATLLEFAEKIGRKVMLDGYSMKTNVEIAKSLGYMKVSNDVFITPQDLHKYPDHKILVLCTGAQGEHNAVLNRIVTDNHRFIKIKREDTIVFSSSVIPGNERSIQRLKDNLYRKCDNVIHSDIMDVHMGGHGTAEDVKSVIKMVNPQYLVPVYANYYMLCEAKKRAVEIGYPGDNVYILENGNILEFTKDEGKSTAKIRKEKADTSYVFIDGLGVGDIGHVVLRDRQMLAEDGMYIITVMVDSKSKDVVGNIQITSRGFIFVKDNFDLINETKRKVKKIIKDTTSADTKMDWRTVENNVRDRVGEYLFQKTQRRPMVLPVIVEV